jgi:uncharacterized protein (DUF927 family)
MEIGINWNSLNKDTILNEKLYEKIIQIENLEHRIEIEDKLFERAKELRIKSQVEEKYKEFKLKCNKGNKLFFGEKSKIPTMIGGNYIIGKDGGIYDYSRQTPILVCSQLIQPVCIYENIEEDKQFIKCGFLKNNKWYYFVQDRLTLSHNGKIVNLANRGVDVTTNNAANLVKYIITMVNLNKDIIPIKSSISRLGWYEDDFIPYDGEVEFDGDENFKSSFNSICEKGDYNIWLKEMYEVRKNKIVRIIHATSFASVLLHKLKKQSFVTMLWGTTGDGKTVAGMTAMSIWGNPNKGKLMFTLNNTDNFYYRTANFFNHLPVFFDELQTYNGDINKLIMNITEGIDRGKAKVDGGVEKNKSWNNAFIMTGEQTASNYNSGGGTLNRLIEINSDGKIIENGSKTVSIITENYGFAGKIFIEQVKSIDKEQLNQLYNYYFEKLKKISDTEDKQAINMAVILLADMLSCNCIFQDEKPLEPEDVKDFMFSKKQIDIDERAYEVFLDECEINERKFYNNREKGPSESPASNGEIWGLMNDYEITIIKKKLSDILEKNGFNYTKTIKGWVKKGYVEVNTNGRTMTNTTIGGRKGYYVTVKVKQNRD